MKNFINLTQNKLSALLVFNFIFIGSLIKKLILTNKGFFVLAFILLPCFPKFVSPAIGQVGGEVNVGGLLSGEFIEYEISIGVLIGGLIGGPMGILIGWYLFIYLPNARHEQSQDRLQNESKSRCH